VQEGLGPRPYDAATRRLIESDPAGWLRWVGLPVDGPVRPLESNLSTVLTEVDKALRVEGPSPWLAHLEIQTGRDPELPSRMLQYHALLRHRDKVPVESTVVLLRREADGPELSRPYDLYGVTGQLTLTFRFRVVRVWERPVEELLSGSLGILPLAPIAAVPLAQVPDVIRELDRRYRRDASPEIARELWAATQVILGLRYDRGTAEQLLRGIRGMRESSTYQAILEEGRIAQARQYVIDLGTEKFGPPDAATIALLARVENLDTLHQLLRIVLRTSTWQELLAILGDH